MSKQITEQENTPQASELLLRKIMNEYIPVFCFLLPLYCPLLLPHARCPELLFTPPPTTWVPLTNAPLSRQTLLHFLFSYSVVPSVKMLACLTTLRSSVHKLKSFFHAYDDKRLYLACYSLTGNILKKNHALILI